MFKSIEHIEIKSTCFRCGIKFITLGCILILKIRILRVWRVVTVESLWKSPNSHIVCPVIMDRVPCLICWQHVTHLEWCANKRWLGDLEVVHIKAMIITGEYLLEAYLGNWTNKIYITKIECICNYCICTLWKQWELF